MIVYVATNLINGKQYVGVTRRSLQVRWRHHCWESTRTHTDMPIAHAIGKYGADKFELRILEECQSLDEMYAAELRWALELKTFSPNGYNLKAGSGPGTMSEETKRKISASNTGRRLSAETRLRLSAAHKNQKPSEATILRARERYKGKSVSALGPTASALVTAKTFILIAPNGEIVEVANMRQFCISKGLSASMMCKVANGHAASHKGWRVPKPTAICELQKKQDQTNSMLSRINDQKRPL